MTTFICRDDTQTIAINHQLSLQDDAFIKVLCDEMNGQVLLTEVQELHAMHDVTNDDVLLQYLDRRNVEL